MNEKYPGDDSPHPTRVAIHIWKTGEILKFDRYHVTRSTTDSRTETIEKSIGHVAIETFAGESYGTKNDRDKSKQFGIYSSPWPDEDVNISNCYKSFGIKFNTYNQDYMANYNRKPDFTIFLYSLDVDAINKAYHEFKGSINNTGWELLSKDLLTQLFLFMIRKKVAKNCAGLALLFLDKGGIDKINYIKSFSYLLAGMSFITIATAIYFDPPAFQSNTRPIISFAACKFFCESLYYLGNMLGVFLLIKSHLPFVVDIGSLALGTGRVFLSKLHALNNTLRTTHHYKVSDFVSNDRLYSSLQMMGIYSAFFTLNHFWNKSAVTPTDIKNLCLTAAKDEADEFKWLTCDKEKGKNITKKQQMFFLFYNKDETIKSSIIQRFSLIKFIYDNKLLTLFSLLFSMGAARYFFTETKIKDYCRDALSTTIKLISHKPS